MKFSGKKLNYKMVFVLAVIFVLFFVLVPSETAFSQVTPPSIEFRCCYSVRAYPQQKICQDFHEDIGCQPPDWAEACPGVRSRCEDITNLPCYQAHCPEWTKPPIIPQKEETPQKETPFVPPKLQIPIPGLTLTTEESKLKICTECDDPDTDPAECPPEKCKNWAYRIPWIGEYLAALYKWAVGALAILAVVMIMINGVRWIIAGGSPDKISEAKKGISSAIIGLVLVLLVHQILSLVDPRLTIFKPIVIGVIKKIPYDIQVVTQGSDSDEATIPENTCADEKKLVKIEKNKFGGVIAADPRLLPDVYEKLLEAQNLAKAQGKSIFITSAFRTLAHQKKLWEEALKKYGSETVAKKYVAKPSCQAPHLTGRAVDVCLAGTPSCQKINGANAYYSDNDVVALQNFMTQAGWVRYCGEWWHFEYGTKRWEKGKDLPPGPNRCK
jgi:hypothetical protein